MKHLLERNYLPRKVCCFFLITSRVVKFIIIRYSGVAFARRGIVSGGTANDSNLRTNVKPG